MKWKYSVIIFEINTFVQLLKFYAYFFFFIGKIN